MPRSALGVSTRLELRTSWNIAPTTDVAVILDRADETDPQRQIHVARWGLVPPWAKDVSVGVRAFNARSETVTEKPTSRAAIKARRCAIPADGYYEWLKPEAGAPKSAKKRPFFIHPQDDSLIFFAGLYEWWKDKSVPEGHPEQWLLSCTILTGPSPEPGTGDEALEGLAGLHDRMPLPMDRDTMEAWLEPEKLGSAEEAGHLVDRVRDQANATASAWSLREVGTAVGNVRNNGPELIEGLG